MYTRGMGAAFALGRAIWRRAEAEHANRHRVGVHSARSFRICGGWIMRFGTDAWKWHARGDVRGFTRDFSAQACAARAMAPLGWTAIAA